MTHEQDITALEQSLAGLADVTPDEWQRVRDGLAGQAAEAGLVDVAFERHDSPLGTLIVGATGEGLVRVGLPAEGEDAVLEQLAERISARVLAAPRGSLSLVRHQLDEYFDGTRRGFEVPLDWRLAHGFRLDVLRATAQIPYGSTASYRDVATRAGNAGAVRAAGSALAHNPLPIVVPCHRVVKSGGALGALPRRRRGQAAAAEPRGRGLTTAPSPGRARICEARRA